MTTSVHWIPREEDKKTIAFQVTPALHERVKTFCNENELSMSDFLRLATSNMLSKLS